MKKMKDQISAQAEKKWHGETIVLFLYRVVFKDWFATISLIFLCKKNFLDYAITLLRNLGMLEHACIV